MSDYRMFQLLNYLTVYPDRWRELLGSPLPNGGPRRPRRRWLAGALAWVGRRMVAVGEGLQARYGRGVETPMPPVANWPGAVL